MTTPLWVVITPTRIEPGSAVLIEGRGEEDFARPGGVRGIDNDDVESALGLGHEFCAIGNQKIGPRVIEGTVGYAR